MRRIVGRIWPHSQTWRAAIVAAFILALIVFLFIRLVGDWSVLANVKNLTDMKDLTGVFQSAVTIVAIVVGGVFAWFKLQAFRDFEPHLTVTHEVHHRAISPNYVHIDVTATLHNSSRVKIELQEADFAIQWIAPASDELVLELYDEVFDDGLEDYLQWPTIDEGRRDWNSGELLVEPGESHHETYEFLVSRDVEVVLVYTYFRNPRYSSSSRSAEGWGASTVYDIVSEDK